MAVEIQLDVWSYTLIAAIIGILFVPLYLTKEPDTHPLALEHQSQPSHIRQPKESAIYRSHETPHGAPLKTGLGLAGEKHWQKLDGELRDVWNLFVEKGNGKVLTVEGVDVTSIDTAQITRWIHTLGVYLTQTSAKRIAVLLPNDVENIVATFACHFYNLPIVLIPSPPDADTTKSILTKTNADILITGAGTLSLGDLERINSLKNVIWVVENASKDLDWNTPPGSRIQTKALHDILEERKFDEEECPPPAKIDADGIAIITSYVPLNTMKREIIEFTHKNIMAGLGSQLSSLPPSERLTPKDTFLPVDTLSTLHSRIATYAALSTGSTLALNSSASPTCNIETICRPVSPTVIIASPDSILSLLRSTSGQKMELWHSMIHFFQTRTLTNSGTIPKGNWFTRFNDYVRPSVGYPNNKLRLCYTYHLAITDSQPLNSIDLADFRIYLAAKIVYQLASPKVAGPICMQNVFDYRIQTPKRMPSRKLGIERECAHFGPPTAAVEVWVKDTEGYKVTDKPAPRGQVWVRGRSVVGKDGETRGVGLGVVGLWRADGCLELTK